jgi:hypothetical protein
MSNEQMKIVEFLFQFHKDKWKPSVSQIIQHMKNNFDWKEQYTQGVLSEMTSNGMLGEIK